MVMDGQYDTDVSVITGLGSSSVRQNLWKSMRPSVSHYTRCRDGDTQLLPKIDDASYSWFAVIHRQIADAAEVWKQEPSCSGRSLVEIADAAEV